MRNKKTVIAIISVVAVILVLIGVTYAYWLVTKEQQGENVISSACLDISLNGSNDINLPNSFPMSDEDGLATEAYTFTVTNNCSTSIDYQVNLETLGSEDNTIIPSAIKVSLNNDVALLSEKGEATPTLSDAYTARKLLYGTLAGKSDETTDDEVTYELRLWIDKDAPISEQNKTFRSKITVTIGQGVFNPYQEGTLAYDILSNYGGANAITSISADWTEGTYSTETYTSMTKSTSYYWGTELDFNKTNRKYKLGGTVVQATTQECRNGQKSDGTAITCSYTLKNSTDAESEMITGYKVTSLTSSVQTDTSSTLYITVQKTGTASNAFSKGTTASDAGLYKAQDDLGDSYYFRGAPTNNYVKFGTYAAGSTVNGVTYAEETPIYWRIVRINGDGTIRLAYDGTAPVSNSIAHTATIGTSVFNSSNAKKEYLGYTYNTSDTDITQVDSLIKSVIDDWYEEHLKTNYDKYIADGIFCNNRELASAEFMDSSYQPVDSFEEAHYYTYLYDTFNKMYYSNPSIICDNKTDRYTMNKSIGNGYLSNPVGLLTADEIMLAGAKYDYSENILYYLNSGESYWTSSPHMYDYSGGGLQPFIYFVESGNFLSFYGYVNSTNLGVRPVINLKADIKFTGLGTLDSPYEIVME